MQMNDRIRAMRLYGGSFVRALAEAMVVADSANLERIEKAFPEVMVKYDEFAGMLKEDEEEED